MKKLNLLLLLLLGISVVFTSCEDDDDPVVLARPEVVPPATPFSIQAGTTGTFNVQVNAPAGIQNITATQSAGTATLNTSSWQTGATSANVEFSYQVPANAVGAAVVTLTVTDQQGQTDVTAITFNVTTDPVELPKAIKSSPVVKLTALVQ
ncbi:MAG: hypothetical protein HC880_19050 [Bacteroidia bacterium]|nr:hypothetical protein [Bacteroidia bacterium]